jgi:hypothetical protein
MTSVPVWIALVIAGASGLASAVLTAILSPLIVSGLQQKSWRKQKLTEMRFQAFQAAISAINAYAADAMDTDLQCAKKSYQGREMAVAIRPETTAAMDSARYLVRSFFSDAVYALYDRAMRTEISIMSTPNASFEGAREQAVLAMAEELRIRPKGRSGR